MTSFLSFYFESFLSFYFEFLFWVLIFIQSLFTLSVSFKFHGPPLHSKLTEWTSEVWIQEKVLNSHAAY